MKKLLTGSRGFIGKNIKSDYVLDPKIDLTNIKELLDKSPQYTDVQTIIHCAGKHGSSFQMIKSHYDYITTNFLCDNNIINFAITNKIPNILMMSSITAFPPTEKDLYTESDIYSGPVNDLIHGYATSKRISIDLCRAAYKDFGINAIPIVLGNCYGKYGKFNTTSTVIHKLIFDIDQAKQNNTNVTLSGDGKDIRSFLYAGDLSKIFDDISTKQFEGKPIIISSPNQVSIRDLVDIICPVLKYDGTVTFSGDCSNIAHRKKVAKSNEIDISHYNITGIEEGIKLTIQYYLENKNAS